MCVSLCVGEPEEDAVPAGWCCLMMSLMSWLGSKRSVLFTVEWTTSSGGGPRDGPGIKYLITHELGLLRLHPLPQWPQGETLEVIIIVLLKASCSIPDFQLNAVGFPTTIHYAEMHQYFYFHCFLLQRTQLGKGILTPDCKH